MERPLFPPARAILTRAAAGLGTTQPCHETGSCHRDPGIRPVGDYSTLLVRRSPCRANSAEAFELLRLAPLVQEQPLGLPQADSVRNGDGKPLPCFTLG